MESRVRRAESPLVKFLVGWAYHDLPVGTDPGALGNHPVVVGQFEMDQPALVGRHRFKGYRSSGVGNPSRNVPGQVAHRLVATSLVAGHVDYGIRPVGKLDGGDEVDEKLQGPEALAFAAYEKTGIVAVNIEDGTAAILSYCVSDAGDSVDFHQVQQVVQNLGYDANRITAGLVPVEVEQRHTYPGRLSAKTQYRRLAPANDVYFYFVAICV